MPTFEIEQYELHAMKYRPESVTIAADNGYAKLSERFYANERRPFGESGLCQRRSDACRSLRAAWRSPQGQGICGVSKGDSQTVASFSPSIRMEPGVPSPGTARNDVARFHARDCSAKTTGARDGSDRSNGPPGTSGLESRSATGLRIGIRFSAGKRSYCRRPIWPAKGRHGQQLTNKGSTDANNDQRGVAKLHFVKFGSRRLQVLEPGHVGAQFEWSLPIREDYSWPLLRIGVGFGVWGVGVHQTLLAPFSIVVVDAQAQACEGSGLQREGGD